MHVKFLLGPAGSGKTWRCLREISEALKASAGGLPLLLLAPKQATFQLERQLLAQPDLAGYTRLQIVSFERLAQFILSAYGQPLRLLDEDGRVMVLRALLARMERKRELHIFHSTARLPGFARQLSLLLRELQEHGVGPTRLLAVSQKTGQMHPLAAKLEDLSCLMRAYTEWLQTHALEDANRLLDLAAEVLRAARTEADGRPEQGGPRLAGLWVDGFAQMTPQEIHLLTALLPFCDRATLAFCLDHEPVEEMSWLSTWSLVAQSYRQCRSHIETATGCKATVELLARDRAETRFAGNEMLAHLERHWTAPAPTGVASASPSAVHLAVCADPEAEAILAAHEIMRHVRAGGRYRECAILVRSLDGYHDVLRRVFGRYGIPCFLDQREAVAHHPLAELTRAALRTVAYGWSHVDWFGALKSGLARASDEEVDWLENAALEHGWEGAVWRAPIITSGAPAVLREAERLRQQLAGPFLELERQLGDAEQQPDGAVLAEALRQLWRALAVEDQLKEWSNRAGPSRAGIHATVFEQMQAWLDNLELAFGSETLPLREWLPIVEAGLSGLTVGLIPPALDQVLVGAVDRSRNPDLRLALVLGLNEGVFPAPPPPAQLLNDPEREELEKGGLSLGPTRRQRLGYERYFGYIACTRARERLVLSWATHDLAGQALNPSLFIDQIKHLFPELKEEQFTAAQCGRAGETLPMNPHPGPLPSDGRGRVLGRPAEMADAVQAFKARAVVGGTCFPTPTPAWLTAAHTSELAPWLLRNKAAPDDQRSQSLAGFETLPVFAPLLAKWSQTILPAGGTLALARPDKLFGEELATSVSALEDYAACPFKFFVARGLRAEERKQFEIDERERGSFQHEALKEFHLCLQKRSRRWRDIRPEEAWVLIRQVGETLRPQFRNGLFEASPARRFHAETLLGQLEKLVVVLIAWAPQYGFDPHSVEVAFGFPGGPLPGWRLELSNGRTLRLRGVIDRVDLCRASGTEEALVAVIDYKSTVKPLHATKLQHGLQLQLLSYLGVLRHLEKPSDVFGVARLQPAGVFYVGLCGKGEPSPTRDDALAGQAETTRKGFQHLGRFDVACQNIFDTRPGATTGDQFRYKFKQDGSLAARGNDALPANEFQQLLDANENHLRRIGREIFAGQAGVSPFRTGSETACDYCKFRPVCRFDPWVEPYRVLRPPPKPPKAEKSRKPARKGAGGMSA